MRQTAEQHKADHARIMREVQADMERAMRERSEAEAEREKEAEAAAEARRVEEAATRAAEQQRPLHVGLDLAAGETDAGTAQASDPDRSST